MSDKINHPDHYGGKKSPYEAIKVIEAWGLGFHLGNAVKYISRVGKKAGESVLDDLRKARWYLDRAIRQREQSEGSSPKARGWYVLELSETFRIVSPEGPYFSVEKNWTPARGELIGCQDFHSCLISLLAEVANPKE